MLWLGFVFQCKLSGTKGKKETSCFPRMEVTVPVSEIQDMRTVLFQMSKNFLLMEDIWINIKSINHQNGKPFNIWDSCQTL